MNPDASPPVAARRHALRPMLAWSLLVLAGLLPIVLLSIYAYQVTSQSVRDLVMANNRSAAQMAAELVGREFESSISLGKASALIPAMAEAVARGDIDVVQTRLKASVQAFSRIELAFAVDLEGRMSANYPENPKLMGESFAYRDYFRGLSRAWKPYISEVFEARSEPKRMVVAVAVPVHDQGQKPVGGIVYLLRLEELTRWVDKIDVGDSGHVFVLDHVGNVAAHPELDLQTRHYSEYATSAPVVQALQGRESTLEYFDPLAEELMVATFVPVRVAEQYWVVVAQQPIREAYAPIHRLGIHLGAATFLVAVATLGVFLGLGRIRRQLRLANRELVAEIAERRQAEQTLHRKQQLLKQLLDIYEGHRKLAAYEIHDGIAQPLAGAVMNCEASLQLLQDGDCNGAREGLRKTTEMLQENLTETRRLMRDLRPTILDDFGVIAAVDQLASAAQASGSPVVEWSHEVQFRRLAPPLETALFRIIQEGLNNACRHSHSKRVRLRLVQQGDRLRLEVIDWGKGFEPERVDENRFGLAGIRERATLFGGELTIETAPGKGTHITVELPVVEAEEDENEG